jgi:hypothetical protein
MLFMNPEACFHQQNNENDMEQSKQRKQYNCELHIALFDCLLARKPPPDKAF